MCGVLCDDLLLRTNNIGEVVASPTYKTTKSLRFGEGSIQSYRNNSYVGIFLLSLELVGG